MCLFTKNGTSNKQVFMQKIWSQCYINTSIYIKYSHNIYVTYTACKYLNSCFIWVRLGFEDKN